MSSNVSDKLMKRMQQVMQSTELMLEKTKDWQMIKAYESNRLFTDDYLTTQQKKKRDRYQYIYNQLVSGKYTEHEVVTMTMKRYQIKQQQAHEDLSCAKEIFTTVINIDRQFEINLQLQINRSLQRKAEEIGDLKAAAAFEKNRVMLLKLLPEQEESPADMFEGHEIEAVFDPKLLGAPDVDMKEILELINQKRKVKIDLEKVVTDIPFEEMNNEETDTL